MKLNRWPSHSTQAGVSRGAYHYKPAHWSTNPNVPSPTALHLANSPMYREIVLGAPQQFQEVLWNRVQIKLTYKGRSINRWGSPDFAAHVQIDATKDGRDLRFSPGEEIEIIEHNIFRMPVRTIDTKAQRAVYSSGEDYQLIIVSANFIDKDNGVLTLGLFIA